MNIDNKTEKVRDMKNDFFFKKLFANKLITNPNSIAILYSIV